MLHHLGSYWEKYVFKGFGEENDVHEGLNLTLNAYHSLNQKHRHILKKVIKSLTWGLPGLSSPSVQIVRIKLYLSPFERSKIKNNWTKEWVFCFRYWYPERESGQVQWRKENSFTVVVRISIPSEKSFSIFILVEENIEIRQLLW